MINIIKHKVNSISMATEIEVQEKEFSFEDLLMNKSIKNELVILPKMVTSNVYKNQTDNFIISAIKSQVVLKIGCGSVGSHTLVKLNKMGVSAFIVFDPDILEDHNSASGMFDYETHKRNFDRGEYRRRKIDMFTLDKKSPFKVDFVYNHYLKSHDGQLFYKPFKARFGGDVVGVTKEFKEMATKQQLTNMYNDNGQSRENNRTHITQRALNDYPNPTIVIMSMDNLYARLNGALTLYKKFLGVISTLPLIDSRIANTLQGEVYTLDIFNEDQMLYWINSMLATKFDTFSNLYQHWLTNPTEFDFHSLTPNECGDTMSVISSSCSALVICSLFRGIFEQNEPNLENVPYLINFSFKNGFAIPYLNGMKFEDLQPTAEELLEELED